jgi:hypothetical protein
MSWRRGCPRHSPSCAFPAGIFPRLKRTNVGKLMCAPGGAKKIRQHTFAGDEGDKLADAFLHAFFCFFGDLGVLWKRRLHYSSDWRKVADVSIGRACTITTVSRCMLTRRRRRRVVGRHDQSLFVEGNFGPTRGKLGCKSWLRGKGGEGGGLRDE